MKFLPKDSKNFFRDNAQLVYTAALLIVIPGALIINTYLFFNNTQKVMKVEMNKKADLASDIFTVSVPSFLNDIEQLQKLLVNTVNSNSEIKALDVLIQNGDDYSLIASMDLEQIGSDTKLYYHSLAWRGGEPISFETNSNATSTISEIPISDEKFWVVVNPVLDEQGNKVALVSIKLSSSVIDQLVQDNLMNGLIVLVITLVIIILLIFNNISLFKSAVRFKKLKEIDELKDEFISMASHELRAPITGIKGYLSMILDNTFGELPLEANAKLQMVSEEANRLNDLVEDLLEVSRIQQGRTNLKLMSVSLSPIVQEIINNFSQQATSKGLKLTSSIQDNLKNIYADEGRIKQILVNLTSNAIKYTPSGSVNISAELVIGKIDMVKIKISDTGMGIAAKDREKLFQKFYRIQNEKTDKIVGTGLGLWITKEIIVLMGGEIFVDSLENKGTDVTVLMPIDEGKK
ncbi:MAG: sensor histidine kinase [Candidatus Kerfeldbacteria bacterium]